MYRVLLVMLVMVVMVVMVVICCFLRCFWSVCARWWSMFMGLVFVGFFGVVVGLRELGVLLWTRGIGGWFGRWLGYRRCVV